MRTKSVRIVVGGPNTAEWSTGSTGFRAGGPAGDPGCGGGSVGGMATLFSENDRRRLHSLENRLQWAKSEMARVIDDRTRRIQDLEAEIQDLEARQAAEARRRADEIAEVKAEAAATYHKLGLKDPNAAE